MKLSEQMDQKYLTYCTKLGDLILRKQQVEEQIEDVKSNIAAVLQTAAEARRQEAMNEKSKCPVCTCSARLPADKSRNDREDQKCTSQDTTQGAGS